jgi:hypothetical protein
MMPNYIEGNKSHDLSQGVKDDEVGSIHVHQIILKDDEAILPS